MTTLTELQTFEPGHASLSTNKEAIGFAQPKVGDDEEIMPDVRQPRQRGRPSCFRNAVHEIVFIFVVASAQLMLVRQH